jgi:predicted nucleic acid-binding protein
VAAVVLDTDVSSRIPRRRLTGRLAGRLPGMDLCVTFVTVGELWKWAELRRWQPRERVELVDFLHNVVVLPYGEAVAQRWGEMAAAAERRGRTLPVNDSWIAACCLARELPLATLNVKDYVDLVEHEGLTLLTN